MMMEGEEMAEMEVEMDEGPSFKRLGVKNTIHTSFADDYVFQIASWYTKLLFSPFYFFQLAKHFICAFFLVVCHYLFHMP